MSISNVLNTLETNIINSYTAIATKGGTIPENKNTNNLSSAIDSIVTGGGSNANFFIQDTQPSGYNGIWVADSTYENYPIVVVADMNSLAVNSINIVKGTTSSTILYDGFTYSFKTIIITDSNGDDIDNINIYYGTGLVWKEILPYIELEYIQSSGSQYIDTGINLNTTNYEIETSFIHNIQKGFEQPIMSIWISSYNYWNLFIKTNSNVVDLYMSGHNNSNSINIGTKYTTTLTRTGNSYNIIVGNVWNKTISYSNTGNTTTLKLFNRGDNNGSSYCSIGTTTVIKEGIKVLELIPCKKRSNNVVCLYDKVSDTYFYNAGTGDFIAGPEV